MRFGLEVEFRRLHKLADFYVFGVVLADRHGLVGDIRNGQHRHSQSRFHGSELVVERFDFVAHVFHSRDDFGSVLLFSFERGNLSGLAVSLRFQRFDFLQNLAALAVEFEHDVNVVLAAASFHSRFYEVGVFHNEFYV